MQHIFAIAWTMLTLLFFLPCARCCFSALSKMMQQRRTDSSRLLKDRSDAIVLDGLILLLNVMMKGSMQTKNVTTRRTDFSAIIVSAWAQPGCSKVVSRSQCLAISIGLIMLVPPFSLFLEIFGGQQVFCWMIWNLLMPMVRSLLAFHFNSGETRRTRFLESSRLRSVLLNVVLSTAVAKFSATKFSTRI
jgi:hypothetical protein